MQRDTHDSIAAAPPANRRNEGSTMNHVLRVSAALALLFLTGVPANGDDCYWTALDGGFFDDPVNWNDGEGGVPDEDDVAIFDTETDPLIWFESDPTTFRALVRSGMVQFRSWYPEPPHTYTLGDPSPWTPALVIGHGGRDVTRLILHDIGLHAANATLGLLPDANGTIRLDDEFTPLLVDEYLIVGDKGVGMVDTWGSGVTMSSGAAVLGNAEHAYGEVMLENPGSQWSCSGPLTIGRHGTGVMTLAEEAAVNSGDTILAQQQGSTGAVILTEDAQWLIDGALDIGMTGLGSLLIEDGSALTNETFATIGTYDSWPYGDGGVGEVILDADKGDASWSIDGDLYLGFFGEGTLEIIGDSSYDASVTVTGEGSIGLYGPGTLRVVDGGTISVGGDLSIGEYGPGTLHLAGGGTISVGGHFNNHDHEHDRIIIEIRDGDDYPTPAIDVWGVITALEPEVILHDAYEPQAGDTFAIAHADIGVYEFSFILPELPEDLQWVVTQDNHDVTLTIISTTTGDVNGDGVVDTEDLLLLLAAWGDCPDPPEECPADFSGDGVVDTADLLALLANWG
jgi:T5SS/PEP-CTERM-associated repeat protein